MSGRGGLFGLWATGVLRQEHRGSKTEQPDQANCCKREAERAVPGFPVDSRHLVHGGLRLSCQQLLYLLIANGANAPLEGGGHLLLLRGQEDRAVIDA